MQRMTRGPSIPWREEPAPAASLIACLLVTPYGVPAWQRLELAEALHARCERLSDRVEWLGRREQSWPDGALLDLGRCAASEAQATCETLLTWTTARQLVARIGIGPTQTLAQLAALRAAQGVVRVVEPERAQAFIYQLPVDTLAGLASAVATPQLVARLRQCGLRTLGQVAQLDARDPQALRRLFGAAAGAWLATLIQGRDRCSMQPAPAPELAPELAPEHASAWLPA